MKQNKKVILQRLARVEGQVRGVSRMVEEERYCVEVLDQVLAIKRALSAVERLMLKDHADACIENAITSGDADDQRRKFRELVDIYGKIGT